MRATEPGLHRVLVAYTANELGTWFGYVALSVAVFDHTHSGLAVAALFIAGRLVPAGLVHPLVARLESRDRPGGVSALLMGEGLIAALLATLLFTGFSLAVVLVLSAADGVAALASRAVMRAAAGRTRGGERDGRRRVAAALNLAWTLTAATGAALAGVAVSTLGTGGAMVVDAVSFVLCGVLLLGLRAGAGTESGVGTRLREAWEYLRGAPALRRLLALQAAALVCFAAATPVEVVYAKSTLHAGTGGYGLIMSMWGAGMVLGGAALARLLRVPLLVLLTAGSLLVGAGYLGFAVAGTLPVACLVAVAGGTGNGMQWGALISAVQELGSETMQGSLMGAVESMGAVFPSLGFALGGVLTAVTGARGALAVAGVAAVAAALAFARMAITARAPRALALAPESSRRGAG